MICVTDGESNKKPGVIDGSSALGPAVSAASKLFRDQRNTEIFLVYITFTRKNTAYNVLTLLRNLRILQLKFKQP